MRLLLLLLLRVLTFFFSLFHICPGVFLSYTLPADVRPSNTGSDEQPTTFEATDIPIDAMQACRTTWDASGGGARRMSVWFQKKQVCARFQGSEEHVIEHCMLLPAR
jgi:hypothetical protein